MWRQKIRSRQIREAGDESQACISLGSNDERGIARCEVGEPDTRRERGPDCVRGLAALLVVYLHACVPYLDRPMPGLVWPVRDEPARLLSTTFWMVEVFIMPLFLLLAGYYAQRSLVGRGGGDLIRSRAQRLLRPLAWAAVLLLPLEYYLWLTGWVIEGQIPADRLWTLKVPRDSRQHLFGSAHLWFLLYLFTYCGILAATWRWLPAVVGRRRIEAGTQVLALPGDAESRGSYQRSRGWDPAALASGSALRASLITSALVGVAVLVLCPQVVFGFQHATLPVPSKWLYSGTYFLGGVWIAAAGRGWPGCRDHAGLLLGCGLISGLAAALLGQWAIADADPWTLRFAIGWVPRGVLATLTVTAAWTLSLGIIGSAERFAERLEPRSRGWRAVGFLAAASFWVYLVHHPLVALLHLDLKLLAPAAPAEIKLAVSLIGALTLSLVSYQLLIRDTRLGILFGIEGKRAPTRPVTGGEPSSASEPSLASQTEAAEPDRVGRRAA
ncbi:MAG: acyltransferase [Planctomycetaceae bacterium]|nr:MAG: acyltransferase [Planctomycetaceae bacterium]